MDADSRERIRQKRAQIDAIIKREETNLEIFKRNKQNIINTATREVLNKKLR